MKTGKYYMMGTDIDGLRLGVYGNSLPWLRKRAELLRLRFYSIYHEWVGGKQFHNATDERYLVEHKDDPYWINRAKGHEWPRCPHCGKALTVKANCQYCLNCGHYTDWD